MARINPSAVCASDVDFMRAAADASLKCEPSAGAYSVGAALVSPDGRIFALGYSRELPGNTHAEECALIKSRISLPEPSASTGMGEHSSEIFKGFTMYSTMEPCSIRLSGKTPCTSLLIAAGITRVVIGVSEPPNFVRCEGESLLLAAGIRVDRCLDPVALATVKAVNSHLMTSPA